MDWLDDPDLLWHSTGLGREEYVQRLLATLVLGAPATGWNVPRRPSERGAGFLRRLHASRFSDTPSQAPVFIDEFELPARHDGERAEWPDHGVDWRRSVYCRTEGSERGICDRVGLRTAAALRSVTP
jgi:hypothetical protein